MTYNMACVISAGRAVLELMQFDWEPLSHGELDQRLDQAVEEILEANLIERAKTQTGPVCLQQIQPPEATPHPLQSEAAELSEESEQTLLSNPVEEDNHTVRVCLTMYFVKRRNCFVSYMLHLFTLSELE